MTISKPIYRPLPDCLTIKNSQIDGLGLFAKSIVPKNTNLGISHIVDVLPNRFVGGMIRTPLAGFINHSCTPNTVLEENYGVYHLIAITDIAVGEELTLNYNDNKCGKSYIDNFTSK